MGNICFTYGLLLIVILQLCLGGYLLLFPKKAKEKFCSEKDIGVRTLGVYIAIIGVLLFALFMMYSRLRLLLGLLANP